MGVLEFSKIGWLVLILGSFSLVCAADPNATFGSRNQTDTLATFSRDATLSPQPLSTGAMMMRTVLALIVVIGLGLLVVYVSKRWLPAFGQISGKEIRVIETVGLGPRKSLHLIEVGSQRLLIGSTPDRISRLADISSGFDGIVQTQLDDLEDGV